MNFEQLTHRHQSLWKSSTMKPGSNSSSNPKMLIEELRRLEQQRQLSLLQLERNERNQVAAIRQQAASMSNLVGTPPVVFNPGSLLTTSSSAMAARLLAASRQQDLAVRGNPVRAMSLLDEIQELRNAASGRGVGDLFGSTRTNFAAPQRPESMLIPEYIRESLHARSIETEAKAENIRSDLSWPSCTSKRKLDVRSNIENVLRGSDYGQLRHSKKRRLQSPIGSFPLPREVETEDTGTVSKKSFLSFKKAWKDVKHKSFRKEIFLRKLHSGKIPILRTDLSS